MVFTRIFLPTSLIILVLIVTDIQTKLSKTRTLEDPVPELCLNRTVHSTFNNASLYFSWLQPGTTAEDKLDWLDARNYCRRRCMDLISLQTSKKNEFIKEKIVEGNVTCIWTSGILCDFEGCDRPDLLPNEINGWFWSATSQKMAPTTNRRETDWSFGGGLNLPQPDNREYLEQYGPKERCLAVLNNVYQDGVTWHDEACYHRKPYVCEDSELLMNSTQSR